MPKTVLMSMDTAQQQAAMWGERRKPRTMNRQRTRRAPAAKDQWSKASRPTGSTNDIAQMT